MPKRKKFKPPEEEAMDAELRKRYGGMMTLGDIGVELGNADPKTVRKWISGLAAVNVNGRLKFRVADIAARMYECRTVAP